MQTDYNVIVAGYGPVGACAANLLGYYNINSLIIDKEKEIYTLPRAITWDDECRRIIVPCNFADKIDCVSKSIAMCNFRHVRLLLLPCIFTFYSPSPYIFKPVESIATFKISDPE